MKVSEVRQALGKLSEAIGEQTQQAISVEMAEQMFRSAKEKAGELHQAAKDLNDRIVTYLSNNLESLRDGLAAAAKEDPDLDPRTEEIKGLLMAAHQAEGSAADLSIVLGRLAKHIPDYIA